MFTSYELAKVLTDERLRHAEARRTLRQARAATRAGTLRSRFGRAGRTIFGRNNRYATTPAGGPARSVRP